MNAKFESKLNMYRATQKHCLDHPSVTSSLPAFEKILTTFNLKVSSIIELTQQEDLATKGITVDKSEAKKSLCRLATDMAAPVFAFASATEDYKMQQEVKFTFTDLLKTKDDVLAPRCQNIKDIATANLKALGEYGLTEASLSTLQTAIENYQSKVPTTRNSAAQKKTIRDNIKKLFAETDSILKDQMDKTIVSFNASNPDFVATYKTNRIIIDPGKSVTMLKGTVQSSKEKIPVSGALITLKDTNLKTTTTKAGTFEIKPVPPGTYSIIISATGFADKTETNVAFKPGQTTTLACNLDPA